MLAAYPSARLFSYCRFITLSALLSPFSVRNPWAPARCIPRSASVRFTNGFVAQAERVGVQDGRPEGQDACGLVYGSRPKGTPK